MNSTESDFFPLKLTKFFHLVHHLDWYLVHRKRALLFRLDHFVTIIFKNILCQDEWMNLYMNIVRFVWKCADSLNGTIKIISNLSLLEILFTHWMGHLIGRCVFFGRKRYILDVEFSCWLEERETGRKYSTIWWTLWILRLLYNSTILYETNTKYSFVWKVSK